MFTFEKLLGFLSILFLFISFLFLVLAENQQKRILKGEKSFIGISYYHSRHKWLKANIKKLPEHKQVEYQQYLFKRKIYYISLSIVFMLYLTYNLLFNFS